MKVTALAFSWMIAQGFAFAPMSQQPATSTSALHLFGNPKEGGDKKGPGMMDQLAMFKKAQEMAQKKQKLDEELKKMEFPGASEDGKVKAVFKYVPISK